MDFADYTYRLKAEAGDTTPHDELGVSGDLSGSCSLVSDGSGGYAWEISGAATLSVPSHAVVSTVDGGGAALVVRMQIATAGTTSDAPRARWDVAATPTYGLGLHRQSNTEVKPTWRTSASIYSTTAYYVPGSDYVTYVVQASCKAASSSDSVDLYYEDGTGSPDLQRGGLSYGGLTLDHLTVGFTGTVQRITDLLLYPGELTPAQARALANDLRGTLDGGATNVDLAAAGTATASGVATIEGGATNVDLAAVGAATASGTADIASSGGVVSISIPVLADFGTGVDITDETGVTAIINDANDGAYVATVTGLAPGATPTALTHASLVDGSLYQVTLLLSGSRRAYLTATASAS